MLIQHLKSSLHFVTRCSNNEVVRLLIEKFKINVFLILLNDN